MYNAWISQISTTLYHNYKAKCLKILLDKGVSTDHLDDNKKGILDYLIEINDSGDCIEILLKHSENIATSF